MYVPCIMAKVSSVNVREIAAKAGVSHITVSRALRNAPNVSPETRAKIQKISAEMGYKPNPLVAAYASQMRRAKGETGGCTLAWLSGEPLQKKIPWLRPYQTGVERRAAELGYSLDETICTKGFSKERLASLIEARGIRGVIVPSLHYFSTEVPEIQSVVMVSLGNSLTSRPVHSVSPNTFMNMSTLFSHLLALGYQRIGFCEHLFGTALTQGAAWGAYLFHQQRLPAKNRLPPLTGLDVGNHEQACEKAFADWVRNQKPDCIISGFMHPRKWLTAMGLSIPEDIGLAHYRLADETPGWSGIDSFPEAMGAAAVDLLSAHIQRNEYGTPEIAKHMKFTGEWIEGQSTRTLRRPKKSAELNPPSHSHSLEWFQTEFRSQA